VSRLRGHAGGFARAEAGSTSIEFLLLLPLYLAVFLSACELGLHMAKQVTLDRATDLAIRDLRLGKLANPTQDLLREEICGHTSLIPNCEASLLIEMTPIDTASWQVLPDQTQCVDREEQIDPVVAFNGGQANDLMLLRACALVDPIFPSTALGMALVEASPFAGEYALVATAAFVNEPGS
jgi:hypothetical protein